VFPFEVPCLCPTVAEEKSGADMAENVVSVTVTRRLSSPGAAPSAETKIKLSSLPPHVAKMLASMDSDGDGTLDWQEIFAGAQAHTAAVSKSKARVARVDLPSRADSLRRAFAPLSSSGKCS